MLEAAPQPPHEAVQQADLLQDGRAGDMLEYIAQGHVQRHMKDRQAVGRHRSFEVQCHGEALRAGALREDLRMSRIA